MMYPYWCEPFTLWTHFMLPIYGRVIKPYMVLRFFDSPNTGVIEDRDGHCAYWIHQGGGTVRPKCIPETYYPITRHGD